MIRLFVAIPLPAAAAERLAPLAGGLPGARWTPADQFHLTLKFIGEVPDARLADVAEALAEIASPSFDLAVQGVGHFATAGQPRMLWAGVESTPPLAALARRVDRSLRAIGMAGDARGFTPHVSLARLRNAPLERVRDFLERHATLALPPFPVEEFVLFSSVLGSERALHRAEAVYALA